MHAIRFEERFQGVAAAGCRGVSYKMPPEVQLAGRVVQPMDRPLSRILVVVSAFSLSKQLDLARTFAERPPVRIDAAT
jgi:hypothetical protein